MNILAKLKETFQKKKASEAMLQEIQSTATQLGFAVYYTDLAHTTGRMSIRYVKGEVVDMRIELIDTLPLERKILTIAHELGHASQFLGECDADIAEWKIYEQVNDLLTIEIDAWMRSVLILHQIGWNDWKTFRDFALRCLATYIIPIYQKQGNPHETIQLVLLSERKKIAAMLDAEIKRITEREVVYA